MPCKSLQRCVVGTLLLTSAFAQAEGVMLADQNGCKIWDPAPVSEESVRWSGPCENGIGEGRGTVEWFVRGAKTEETETTLRAGKYSGFSKVNDLNNQVVTEAEYVDGVLSGYGSTRSLSSGVRYEGEFRNGVFEGLGTLSLADGSVAQGHFKGGLMNGFIVQTTPEGKRFSGLAADGKLDGPITMIYPDDDRLDARMSRGAWVLGSACQYNFQSGESYTGMMRHNPDGSYECARAEGNQILEFFNLVAQEVSRAALAQGYKKPVDSSNPYAFIATIQQLQREQILARQVQSNQIARSTPVGSSSAPSPASNSSSSTGIPDGVAVANKSAGTGGVHLPTTYAAWRCVSIEHTGNGQQRIVNGCAFPAEVYWKDDHGGWNQASVAAGAAYIGGMTAVYALACNKGDFLNKHTEVCKP